MTQSWARWVARVGDEAIARRISEAHGGRMLSVPSSAEGRAIEDLALHLAPRLVELAGGTRIYVPCLPRGGRHGQIRAMAAEGLSRAEISRRLGCSDRWVRKVLSPG